MHVNATVRHSLGDGRNLSRVERSLGRKVTQVLRDDVLGYRR